MGCEGLEYAEDDVSGEFLAEVELGGSVQGLLPPTPPEVR